MDTIYFFMDAKTGLYLVNTDGFANFPSKITLLHPVYDRNEIHSMCHATSLENANSWLEWIKLRKHPSLDEGISLDNVIVVSYKKANDNG